MLSILFFLLLFSISFWTEIARISRIPYDNRCVNHRSLFFSCYVFLIKIYYILWSIIYCDINVNFAYDPSLQLTMACSVFLLNSTNLDVRCLMIGWIVALPMPYKYHLWVIFTFCFCFWVGQVNAKYVSGHNHRSRDIFYFRYWNAIFISESWLLWIVPYTIDNCPGQSTS